MAKTAFASTELGREAYTLYKEGVLRGFSIGFVPIVSRIPNPADIKADPRLAECRVIYDKWELAEYSCVSVPANPEALAVAVSKGYKPTLAEIASLMTTDGSTECKTEDAGSVTTEHAPIMRQAEYSVDPSLVARMAEEAIAKAFAGSIRELSDAVAKLSAKIQRLTGRV